MKLSVKRKWGCVQVRGGRVMVAAREHSVAASSYDARTDAQKVETTEWSAPFKKRAFDKPWVTAAVGDLAIEIVGVKVERVLGYGYLAGPAINVIRYVSDQDRALVASWFTPGVAVRLDLTDVQKRLESNALTVEHCVAGMMAIKYGEIDVAVVDHEVPSEDEIQAVFQWLAQTYSYDTDEAQARGHLMGCIRHRKRSAFAHFQPPKHASDYACQPFFFDLVNSSPHLTVHQYGVAT